jgi:hypothetical protein
VRPPEEIDAIHGLPHTGRLDPLGMSGGSIRQRPVEVERIAVEAHNALIRVRPRFSHRLASGAHPPRRARGSRQRLPSPGNRALRSSPLRSSPPGPRHNDRLAAQRRRREYTPPSRRAGSSVSLDPELGAARLDPPSGPVERHTPRTRPLAANDWNRR